ncbi:MAG: type I methionyl aminopeptidase [Patescibacteria group bacterium]
MINYKSASEIEVMKKCGEILKEVVSELLPRVKEGMTTENIDEIATKLIKNKGGDVSFNKVKGYRWATCLTVNEQVVHTPPSKRRLINGDILTIDIGVYYKGFHTDYATTIVVGGKTDPETEKFLRVGKEALDKAIAVAKKGARIGDISKVIQKQIQGNGYFVMKELTGHGVGRELHEDPYVPGFLDRPVEKTLEIKPGLVIAVEVIYSKGTEEIAYEEGNDWSIVSADSSLTACFEHTIAITEKGTLILT